MKNVCKRILAASCIALMIMSMPGVTVLANELQDEDIIVSIAEDPC